MITARSSLLPALAAVSLVSAALAPANVTGLLSWRGPSQTGVLPGTDYPEKWGGPGGENHLWTYKVKGGGTPVFANGKLYCFGYYDDPQNLSDVQEALICLDPETGKLIWEYRFDDYISDVVYNRYAVGSPIVDGSDPEPGRGRARRSDRPALRRVGGRAARERVHRTGPPSGDAGRGRGRGQGPAPRHRGGDGIRPEERRPANDLLCYRNIQNRS